MKKIEAENKLGGPREVARFEDALVSMQLLAPNEQTGLGQPGAIVRVAMGTAIRMVRLRMANIVPFETSAPMRETVAPAPPVAKDKEVA